MYSLRVVHKPTEFTTFYAALNRIYFIRVSSMLTTPNPRHNPVDLSIYMTLGAKACKLDIPCFLDLQARVKHAIYSLVKATKHIQEKVLHRVRC